MEKKTCALKIVIKELELEMSKEQALRTGIVAHLFKDRKNYDFEMTETEQEKVFPSDIQGIKIQMTGITIEGY